MWTAGHVEAALCRRGWFSEQDSDFRRQVLASASWREYGHGEIVLSENDTENALYAVVAGLVKYSFLSETGEEYLAKIFKPGDWFNLIAMLDSAPLPLTAHVSGQACMLRLSQSAFESLVSAQPHLYRHFAGVLCGNLRDTAQRLVDLNALGREQRLAKFLLEIDTIERSVDAAGEVDMRITQAELCQLLVLSRATTNRILQSWNTAGWINNRYGRVSIINHQQLEHLACGRESYCDSEQSHPTRATPD